MNSSKPPSRDTLARRIVDTSGASIARAVDLLRAGELVAFPTETVYGLGADAGSDAAVRAIFAAKGRPADHPLIVHVSTANALSSWGRDVPQTARDLAKGFWPGPLTLIVPRAPHVRDVVTGGQDTIGLRVPSHPVAQRLLAAFEQRGGSGIAAPSANRFGHVSPTLATHVADDLGAYVALILDGGASEVGIESTIVACVDDEPMLLRPGAVSTQAIELFIGRPLRGASIDAPRASGTLDSHYATRTQAFLAEPATMLARIAQLVERDERVAVLARSVERPPGFEGTWVQAAHDRSHYTHDLYANLRRLDDSNADSIVIEAVPDTSDWLAVRDRLARASHDDDRA
ncbi:MAG TPA: L-threonylcarbamoyladenylate synthase [Casimicrobiaceae bacterium]|nr:L-threonylcarbamoyladenylate synthase [Casimicrobiaceae bacterium]